MTIGLADIALYTGALMILFLTPGPVWVALSARALSGGFSAAWPLALGVVAGDLLWPLLAIMGVTWIVNVFAGFMTVLRWVACGTFLIMGILILRNAGSAIARDSRLTRPGRWAGFGAGLAVILGNPKAILFYMGALPGFFDLTTLRWPDMMVIVAISALVPLVCNLALAFGIDRAKRSLTSPRVLKRINIAAGLMLIAVGLVIPLI
ncbi:LysE family translocator [Oceaniglobus indicus]|uniref:LysE family translocator n=1 Tax=Oceaniglobus indicus TaxID=2047749 RepID=UPI000C19F71D|nr:LysE family translocator [Oceaniglobus indicus]